MVQKLDPFNQNKTKQIPKRVNLVETLKDQANDATLGMVSTAIDQLTGRRRPTQQSPQPIGPIPQEQPFNWQEFLQLRERQIRLAERRFVEQRRTVEKVVFSQKEEETQKEIAILRESIKQLVETAALVDSDLKKVAFEQVVNPGVYHLTFFERIKRLIIFAKKKVEEAKSWLDVFQSRQRERCFYWGQVQKSGTKFMLSQERYMATQVG